eukprot:UN00067
MAMYGKNPFPQPSVVDESRMMLMEQAKMEMDAFSSMFNMVNEKCTSKCLATTFSDAELNTNEQACLDRCVVKIMETQNYVSQVLQRRAEQQLPGQMPAGGAPPQ